MKILMHDNALNERGTTNAVETYAQILTTLGWSVTVAFESDNSQNVPRVIKRIGDQFDLLPYKEFSELERGQNRFDVAYFQKSGAQDGKVFRNTPSIVHAVFQEYDPHGQSYIYISDWLAARMKSQKTNPRHLVKGARAKLLGCSNALRFEHLPYASNVERLQRVRTGEHGLTEEAFVILRYGGFDTFDVPWVQEELVKFVEEHDDVVALMVNTQPFTNHERIMFLPKFTSPQERDQLLAVSDLCIHARQRGESFGLFVVEAMQSGRQIFSWSGGIDTNHVDLLSGTGALFADNLRLREMLQSSYGGIEVVDCDELVERASQFKNHNIAPKLEGLINKIV